MAFTDFHRDLLQRFADRFDLPRTPESVEPWTRQCMEQFRFSDPAQNWGCKSTSPGSAVSDAFAIGPSESMLVYDAVVNAGASNASLNLFPAEWLITDQNFIPVGAHDWLGDGGPVHSCALGASLFWGLGGIANNWPELPQQFEQLRDASVDYVRTFVHLNSDNPNNPWRYIGASVDDSNLEEKIQLFDDMARHYGRKVGWVFTGGIDGIETTEQQNKLVDRICSVLQVRLDNVYYCEMANEYLVNGLNTSILRSMARRTRSLLPGLERLSLSSPNAVHNGGTTEEIHAEVSQMYDGCPEANAITPHWDRSVNRPPDLGPSAPAIVICNEPRGPMSSVAQTANPADIVGDYQAAAQAGYDSYVLHGDSLIWSQYIYPEPNNNHGFWPVFTDHENGQAILDAVRNYRLSGTVPDNGGGGGGGGEPMIPYDEAKSVEFGLACNDVYTESGAPFDPGMVSVHSSRAAWDYYVGGMSWEDSKHKHINEFRAEYGLPPI